MYSARSTRSTRSSARVTRSARSRRPAASARSATRYTTRRTIQVADDSDDEPPQDVVTEESVMEVVRETRTSRGSAGAPAASESDDDGSDSGSESDSNRTSDSASAGSPGSGSGVTSTGEDSDGDTSASGVTESELEPVDGNKETVTAVGGVSATPNGYVPRHHWDTRMATSLRRSTTTVTSKARQTWTTLRQRAFGAKSPMGRAASALRGFFSPKAITDGAEVAQRLQFNQSPQPSPQGSPIVLTINEQEKSRGCVNGRCIALWLGLLLAVLFMLLLGWWLVSLAPGLFEKPLVSQADRDMVRASGGGVPLDTVEKMIKAANTRQHTQFMGVLDDYRAVCAAGAVVASHNITELRLALDSLRQHHEGDMSAANHSVSAVRDELLNKVIGLNTEVGNILGRLDSLDVQAGEASESIAQLRGALKAMQDELRDLKASVDDIPNHHPSHSWVREHVAAEIANHMSNATATEEALRVGDKATLSAHMQDIAATAQLALKTAQGARDAAQAADEAARAAQVTADEAKALAAAADETAAGVSTCCSGLTAPVEQAVALAGEASTTAKDAAIAADSAIAEAQRAAAAAAKASETAEDAKVAADSAATAAADAQKEVRSRPSSDGEASAGDVARALEQSATALEAAGDAAKVAAGAKDVSAEALEKAEAARDLATTGAANLAALGAERAVASSGGVSEARAREIVAEAIDQYAADGVGRPDFALGSAGASIVYEPHLLSKTFEPTPTMAEKVLCLVGLVPHRSQSPGDAIDPDVNVGKCWPMDGSSGRITIRVSDVGGVIPTHFSIDHAHHDVAHSLASAPRNCEAWGYRSEEDDAPVKLASFEYNVHGAQTQTFERTHAKNDATYFPLVQLRVLDNWGNPHHTCLYRVRVHGKPKHFLAVGGPDA